MNPAAQPIAPGLQVAINDCWSRIGVGGDGSCPELQQHVHCRNCPVYSAAGAQLLERALMPDYRRDWALHFARPKQAITAGAISVVLFRIGGEWLALPTSSFQEVAELRKIHTIPHRRKGTLLGLVNVRGELVLCLALDKILGLARAKEKAGDRAVYERLLVATAESRRIAVAAYQEGAAPLLQVIDATRTLADARMTYARALHARLVSLLELYAAAGLDPVAALTVTPRSGETHSKTESKGDTP